MTPALVTTNSTQCKKRISSNLKIDGKYKEVPGPKPKVTGEVLAKLREAWMWGCTDEEACLHAKVSQKTLHNYQNANPEFNEEKKKLKKNPILMARKTIVDNIPVIDTSGRPSTAMWFASRGEMWKEFKEAGLEVDVKFDLSDRLVRAMERKRKALESDANA